LIPKRDSYISIDFSINNENEKAKTMENILYAITLFRLRAFLFKAKNIGMIKPKTLLDAMINAFKNVNDKGMIFFLNLPSNKKYVKKIRFRIETGLPPWNMPFEVPSNL
tara:strand:+ start:621 stop:947 length:327 start_codon:yes stop_codon:yes gene_type:complete